MMLPRGIRNHNPGNIEHSPKNKWQGLASPPTDGRFCVFKTPTWGLRALAVLLIAYYDRYDCDTVEKIIARWAPEHENPLDEYISHVASVAGVGAKDPLVLHEYTTLLGLMHGIVTFENGPGEKFGKPHYWYPGSLYDEALRRAGVVADYLVLT